MKDALSGWADERRCLIAWGPARMLLEQVRSDLERREQSSGIRQEDAAGQIDAAFAAANLTFDYDCGGLEDGSLIVMVMPRPAHLVGFLNDGARVNLLMPPTYQRYVLTSEDVRQDVVENAIPGYRVAIVQAPVKLLAARVGLVRYGRNNLTYAPPWGSYVQLLAFATDAPLAVAPGWAPQEPLLLDECADCGICRALCPTAAIGEDRILLKAERCLTLANETPGAWPPHVPPAAHHCLFGCLACQRDCPVNPALPIEDSGVVFSEEETRALIAEGEHEGEAWARIRDHLGALGQPDAEPVIGRNLRAVLAGYK